MYTVEYYEYDWDQNLISQGTFTTESKNKAWWFFQKSIHEHYNGKDFWDSISWNDRLVETLHSAEDGYNRCLLHKWEDFDDDISLAWKYGEKRYMSLKELWEEVPKFNGCTMETDEPYIRNNEDGEIAELHIVINWPGC